MKTVLIVCGGLEAADAAKRARDMGLHVVVSDIDPNAAGFAHAHDRLIADVHTPEETAAVALQFHRETRAIDGVLCVAADAPLTAALVAERLGLPGIPVATAARVSDKLAVKQRLAECGIAVPWFAPVMSPRDVQSRIEERGKELVIKPVDGRDRLGMQLLSRAANVAAAYALAERHSRTRRVMVEDYLEGPQMTTESVFADGDLYTPGFRDCNRDSSDTSASFFAECGSESPSLHAVELQNDVKILVAQTASALGLTTGTVKTDIALHKGKPHIVGLSTSLSGGYFSTRQIPLSTGVDFTSCAIRAALGEHVYAAELQPWRQQAVVQRYVFPRPGRIVAIRGADAAHRRPGVASVVVSAKVGDIVPPPGSSRSPGALVIATGHSREEALAVARDAIGAIEIETK